FNGTPGTAKKALIEHVRPVCAARFQLAAKRLQRRSPLFTRWPSVLRSARGKGSREEFARLRRQVLQGNAVGRWLHLSTLRVRGKGKAAFPNRLFDRHVASSKESPRKRMAPHEQQVEHEHREAKVVVIGRAHDLAKV